MSTTKSRAISCAYKQSIKNPNNPSNDIQLCRYSSDDWMPFKSTAAQLPVRVDVHACSWLLAHVCYVNTGAKADDKLSRSVLIKCR